MDCLRALWRIRYLMALIVRTDSLVVSLTGSWVVSSLSSVSFDRIRCQLGSLLV